MATLKPKHKSFIVKQIACYEKPVEIKDKVQEKYQVEVTLSQLAFYNPENTQGGQQLSRKWKAMFNETREKFLEGSIDVPIANKMVRLQRLEKLWDVYYEMGNYGGCERVLEQAAKQMNGAYGPMKEMLADKMGDGNVNFYQQINNKIVQLNQK